MLAIVAALEQELAPLRKRLGARAVEGEAGFRLYRGELSGRPLVLAQTGVGAARAEAAATSLVKRYELGAILSVGLAGALKEDLRAGDLLILSQVHLLEGEMGQDPPAMSDGLACDRRLVELAVGAAQRMGLAFQQGASLTVPALVGQPDLKRHIGSCLPVEAVEMESYWVGRVAVQHGIPFLALRAISDAVGERLPDLQGVVDEEGAVQAGRVLPLLLRRPLYAPTLLRLARDGRRAAQSLATLIEAFVSGYLANDWRGS